jgi:hypothetical protein
MIFHGPVSRETRRLDIHANAPGWGSIFFWSNSK